VRHDAAAPNGRQAPAAAARLPEAARQAAAVRRVAAVPFAAVLRAVLAAAAQVSDAQVSEAPPSAAVAALYAALAVAARRRVVAVLHVVAAERTFWEQPVTAARVEARQPLEQFGMAISAFGLAALFAGPAAVAWQHRILAQPAARLDQMRDHPVRRSATVEHRKPVPSPEPSRRASVSTPRAPAAYPWHQAPAGRWSSEAAYRTEPAPALACPAAPLSQADARSRAGPWQAEL
jgi:hypothetical protein